VLAELNFANGSSEQAEFSLSKAWGVENAPLRDRIACMLPFAHLRIPPEIRIALSDPSVHARISPRDFEIPCPAALRPLCEALLDCKETDMAKRFALGLAFAPPRKALASAVRRSLDHAEAERRFDSIRNFGWLDSRVLTMLAFHSDWCESNGAASLARSELEKRALNRVSKRLNSMPRTRKTL
jgi:hypothetical protein